MTEAVPANDDAGDAVAVEAAGALLSAAAVKERTAALFAEIEAGRSEHFRFDPDALPAIARRVAELTRSRFPDLAVPLHARWRHFEVGGHDRFAGLAAARDWQNAAEAARAMGDLAIVSVLLDAGAGPTWRYREAATGEETGRSEGLALASFAMFVSGAFSAVPADPLRADAAGLESLTADEFAAGFQIGPDNHLEGAEGRRLLLADCAAALRAQLDLFASEDDPRPGGLIDALAAEAVDDSLPAETILSFVLEGLGPIWPSRIELGGVPMGDTWRHPALGGDAPGSDLVPFHKLSTWLSLSLIEPLAARGIAVTALDGLPGLAEYRNGGLFVDGGALVLTDPAAATTPHTVDEPLIVEWRAATVTLLSRLAPMVRAELGASDDDLPLAAILEGGTWLAGRRMAKERRSDGGPPIAIVSDGTVF
ncbi:MAG: URC4/urg3 family protein [Acuticoccus sp.]